VAAHGRAALVTVHRVKGSVPREAGARMIVRADGALHGTIGGGQLEWQMLALARDALARGRGPARFVDQALGPDLGQCCGGRVTVLVETFDPGDAVELEGLAQAETAGMVEVDSWLEEGRVRRTPVIPGQGPGPRSGVNFGAGKRLQTFATSGRGSPSLASGSPGSTDAGDSWREPLDPPLTPIALFGAGHVGRALVLALAPLPFVVRWIDSRDEAFPRHIPSNVTPALTSDPAAEIAHVPADAFVLVMTHEHPLDLAITAAALGRGFPFVGLIGSRTKRARFEKRFRELGIAEERIEALACPIGLPGIAGKEPAVIAASAVAQLLAVREKHAANSLPSVSSRTSS
jgi:xanthine dehydrogenase accessory factor